MTIDRDDKKLIRGVIMRALFSAAFAAAFLLSGPALADEAKPDDPSKPVPLTAAQMDQVTGSGLFLPNMKEVFAGFDNPAPFDFHPNFDRESGGGARSTTAAAFNDGAGGGVTAFKGPVNGLFGNEGPWSAHFASPVISCIGC